jgi:hypothetical protein
MIDNYTFTQTYNPDSSVIETVAADVDAGILGVRLHSGATWLYNTEGDTREYFNEFVSAESAGSLWNWLHRDSRAATMRADDVNLELSPQVTDVTKAEEVDFSDEANEATLVAFEFDINTGTDFFMLPVYAEDVTDALNRLGAVAAQCDWPKATYSLTASLER